MVAPVPPRSVPPWARVVREEADGCGPLGGLYAGLQAAGEEKSFVAGCDMPFLQPCLVEGLLALAARSALPTAMAAAKPTPPKYPKILRLRRLEGGLATERYDVVIPEAPDGLHPLCAVYSRRCLGDIRQALEAGERRVVSFFPQVRVRLVRGEELRRLDPELASLFNINTPEDLAAAERLLAADRRG